MQKTSVVFDMMSITSKGKGNCKKMSRHRKRSLPQAKDIVVEKKTTMMDSSSRPQFEDEDYIVFCFKEDGALDVIKNGNNSQTSHYIDLVSTSSRPVSRKVLYTFMSILWYDSKWKINKCLCLSLSFNSLIIVNMTKQPKDTTTEITLYHLKRYIIFTIHLSFHDHKCEDLVR